jgi:hypothetical protein
MDHLEILGAWLLIGGLLLVLAGEPWGFSGVVVALVFDRVARTAN